MAGGHIALGSMECEDALESKKYAEERSLHRKAKFYDFSAILEGC